MKSNQVKIFFFLTGIILGSLFWAVPKVSADGDWGNREGKGDRERWEKKREEINKQLGLTPEQEKQLKEHRENHRSQREGLHQQIKAKREAIRSELQKADFNVDKVKQIHGELKSLQAQEEDNRLEAILEVRKILTSEQFNKFKELRANWKDHKKHKGSDEHSMKGDE